MRRRTCNSNVDAAAAAFHADTGAAGTTNTNTNTNTYASTRTLFALVLTTVLLLTCCHPVRSVVQIGVDEGYRSKIASSSAYHLGTKRNSSNNNSSTSTSGNSNSNSNSSSRSKGSNGGSKIIYSNNSSYSSTTTSTTIKTSTTTLATAKFNILFLVADDLRYQLGRTGPGVRGPGCTLGEGGRCQRMVTPNLDKLAASSALFQRNYVQQAICSATRQSLLTGRRPDATRVWDLVSYWRDVGGNYTTIPQHFRNVGYKPVAGGGKIFVSLFLSPRH